MDNAESSQASTEAYSDRGTPSTIPEAPSLTDPDTSTEGQRENMTNTYQNHQKCLGWMGDRIQRFEESVAFFNNTGVSEYIKGFVRDWGFADYQEEVDNKSNQLNTALANTTAERDDAFERLKKLGEPVIKADLLTVDLLLNAQSVLLVGTQTHEGSHIPQFLLHGYDGSTSKAAWNYKKPLEVSDDAAVSINKLRDLTELSKPLIIPDWLKRKIRSATNQEKINWGQAALKAICMGEEKENIDPHRKRTYEQYKEQ
ncbi:hypothetical protein N7468_000761 [Penicillium chermesinum]|uniref:Uncharacterized protein n=1 Tax=Penicillium chermesinum TaxID=63820 RepID=A0A9W9PMS5_9EURO|nr:uncharacterized protein N7468_000761 [Penicillium chermesinum]KAJ5249310.1 hypothetical protein N7468_000761 [Penicillium chermesinum]